MDPLEESIIMNRILEKRRKSFKMQTEMISKIKKRALKQIRYPEYKEAYDYVDNAFPGSKVKDVVIYKVSEKGFRDAGLEFAEGFYDPYTKIVVISGVKRYGQYNRVISKISRDEVMVHELCHYVYFTTGQRSISLEMEEEFAYGWSIGYLRQKGHSDEEIIKDNFLPFLVQNSTEKALRAILASESISTDKYNNMGRYTKRTLLRKLDKRIRKKAEEIATERGKKIVEIYSKQIEKGSYYSEEKYEADRCDLMDL